VEYNKFLVSLYSKDSSCPKMFIVVNKRNNNIFVSLKQSRFKGGILIFYNNKNFVWCEVKSNNDVFSLDLGFYEKFCVCFYSDEMYFGKKGNIKVSIDLLDKFDNVLKKITLNIQIKKEQEFDKHMSIDLIIEKIFNDSNIDYYLNMQKVLEFLFSNGERVGWLENEIPQSKFVVVGNCYCEFCVGIIYKNNKPNLIAVGCKVDDCGKVIDGKKYLKHKKDLWEFTFRRASDGDIL